MARWPPPLCGDDCGGRLFSWRGAGRRGVDGSLAGRVWRVSGRSAPPAPYLPAGDGLYGWVAGHARSVAEVGPKRDADSLLSACGLEDGSPVSGDVASAIAGDGVDGLSAFEKKAVCPT